MKFLPLMVIACSLLLPTAFAQTPFSRNAADTYAAQTSNLVRAKTKRVPAQERLAIEKAKPFSQGEERLGNFEIQRLMSDLNEAETLASSLQKKSGDCVICNKLP